MGILSAKSITESFDCTGLISTPYSLLDWCLVFIPKPERPLHPAEVSKIEGFVKTTHPNRWNLIPLWMGGVEAFFDEDGWLVEKDEDVICRISLRICSLWIYFSKSDNVAAADAKIASSLDYQLHRGSAFTRLFASGAVLSAEKKAVKKEPIQPVRIKVKPKLRVKTRKGFVYVVKAGQNHFKVGFSIDPSDRLSNYRSLMPEACVVKLFPDLTMREEKILHKKLRAMFAGQGEVYYVSEEDLLNAMSQILTRINYQE